MTDYNDEDDEVEIIDLTDELKLNPDDPVEELDLPAQGDRNEHNEGPLRIGVGFKEWWMGTVGQSRLISFLWLLVVAGAVFGGVTYVVSSAPPAAVLIGGIAAVGTLIWGSLYIRKDHTK